MNEINNKKWRKLLIFIIILVLLLIFIIIGNKLTNSNINKEYRHIKYSIPIDEYCSCIDFMIFNSLSENSCDSEPSNMPYSGEFYQSYRYNSKSKIISFHGIGVKTKKAKVLEWSEEKFKIQLLGDEQNEACSVNKKDIYEYYIKERTLIGKDMKNYLNELDKDGNLIIEYWQKTKSQQCTNNGTERCTNASIITKNEIYEDMDDDAKYQIEFFRDEKGKTTSVIIRLQNS